MNVASKNDFTLIRTSFRHKGLEGGVYRGGKKGALPLVLQHGLTGDHRGLLELAQELSSHYEIYLVELPGHLDCPVPESDVTLQDLATWFSAVLASIKPAPTVIAHSFGCSVALRALAMQPGRLDRCVLMNPVPHTASHVKVYQWLGQRMPYELAKRVDAHPLVHKVKMKSLFRRKERVAELSQTFLPQFGSFTAERAAFYLSLGRQVQRDDIYHDPRLKPLWKRVAAIVGPHDTLLGMQAKRILRRLIAPDHIISVARTGHLSPVEAPEETAVAIHQLLD